MHTHTHTHTHISSKMFLQGVRKSTRIPRGGGRLHSRHMRSVKFQKCVRRILASSFHRCVGARCVSVVFVCGTVLFVFVTVFLCFGTVFCVFGTRIVVGIARVLSAAVVRARIREHEHMRANAHACAHTTDQGALSFVVCTRILQECAFTNSSAHRTHTKQIKERVFEAWQKSPENPVNQQ